MTNTQINYSQHSLAELRVSMQCLLHLKHNGLISDDEFLKRQAKLNHIIDYKTRKSNCI